MCNILIEKAKFLGPDWTAESVGKALWTKAILSSIIISFECINPLLYK